MAVLKFDLRSDANDKEKRNDCTQGVLGLWIDQEGIPLGLGVYPGNTFEGKTLPEVIERLRKKYRIKRIIWVHANKEVKKIFNPFLYPTFILPKT
ncbi:MAG: hypothetical protein HYS07_03755 [Chlamydiae bacterium]|nr:hypothetical protein [Chlamydiota bacterium]MBI3277126.1 hypothetical protein [Chlamydiota bacterium]